MRITVLSILAVSLLLAGCASVPRIQYSKGSSILLPDSTSAEQTINGVTIKIKPFDVYKEVANPKYKKKITVYYTPYFAPIYETFDRHLNIFSGTTPFDVTIINGTDQILKMEETRVMYLDPITEGPAEPYMALDLGTIMQNPGVLPVFEQTVNSFANLKPQSTAYVTQIGSEIISLAKQLKIVNSPSLEIMPGMKYTGIIMIPIQRDRITVGKLSFIDMVTKSATAGYATEKVRYDFTVRNSAKYWKRDNSVSKDWVEITAEEYNAGVIKK